MVTAATNRMAVAVCDRCGPERGVEWVAGTSIAGPDGWLLAGPAPAEDPALLLADVDLAATRDKSLGPRNDVHADRLPPAGQPDVDRGRRTPVDAVEPLPRRLEDADARAVVRLGNHDQLPVPSVFWPPTTERSRTANGGPSNESIRVKASTGRRRSLVFRSSG